MLLSPTLIEQSTRFMPLLVVLALAVLTPVVLSRFRRLPIVVGEILAGIVVGVSGLNWVGDDLILVFMGDIGLAFLMFLAGMEIDFEQIFPREKAPKSENEAENIPSSTLLVSLGVYALTFLLAVPGGFLIVGLGMNADPWLLAFILSATSLGVLLPIMKERNLMNSFFGQFVFITATLSDFITVLLFTVFIITFDHGFSVEIFSIGLLFIAFIILARTGVRFVRIPVVGRFFDEMSKTTVQIKVRAALAILLAFVVLAEYVNAELILGAFLAGMIISLLKGPKDIGLIHSLEAFGFGFFIPVFFILVGATLDLKNLFDAPEKLLILPALLVISLVVKLVPVLLVKRYFSWKEFASAGLLLNTHLSLEIAVAVIGMRVGLMDAASNVLIIFFAILTVVLMPLIFSMVLPVKESAIGRAYKLIAGVNKLSLRVAKDLLAHEDTVIFAIFDGQDDDEERVSAEGFPILKFAKKEEFFDELNVTEVEAFLALFKDDSENLAFSRLAHKKGIKNIIAYVKEPSLLPEFQKLGVQAYTPAILRATLISMMARSPNAFSIFTSYEDKNDSVEIRLRNKKFSHKPLNKLELPGNYLVLAIDRDGELIIPRGNTRLKLNDTLTIFGAKEHMPAIRLCLEKSVPLTAAMSSGD
jgi:Kef-type K+ transport system membrane component KefB